MFNQGLGLGFLRTNADNSYAKRVFDLYLKRHQDDLLGFGYHHYQRSGRGMVELTCGFRDLFFGKGFYPGKAYQTVGERPALKPQVAEAIAQYDPETEVIVYLKIHHSDLNCLSRLSKNGLALSVIHRQYLDRLLSLTTSSRTVAS